VVVLCVEKDLLKGPDTLAFICCWGPGYVGLYHHAWISTQHFYVQKFATLCSLRKFANYSKLFFWGEQFVSYRFFSWRNANLVFVSYYSRLFNIYVYQIG